MSLAPPSDQTAHLRQLILDNVTQDAGWLDAMERFVSSLAPTEGDGKVDAKTRPVGVKVGLIAARRTGRLREAVEVKEETEEPLTKAARD
mmetsp:Transcript_53390/g.115914  ORF Transcript_53390/g.115914 Transcript_53390/m.115914 type:complete len:90 (+) Transcript_53390:35-304(+)